MKLSKEKQARVKYIMRAYRRDRLLWAVLIVSLAVCNTSLILGLGLWAVDDVKSLFAVPLTGHTATGMLFYATASIWVLCWAHWSMRSLLGQRRLWLQLVQSRTELLLRIELDKALNDRKGGSEQ